MQSASLKAKKARRRAMMAAGQDFAITERKRAFVPGVAKSKRQGGGGGGGAIRKKRAKGNYHMTDMIHYGKAVFIGPRGGYVTMKDGKPVYLSRATIGRNNYNSSVATDRSQAAAAKRAARRAAGRGPGR